MLRADTHTMGTKFAPPSRPLYLPRSGDYAVSAPVSPVSSSSQTFKSPPVTLERSRGLSETTRKHELERVRSAMSDSSSLVMDESKELPKSLNYLVKPRQKLLATYSLPEVMAARDTPPLSPEAEVLQSPERTLTCDGKAQHMSTPSSPNFGRPGIARKKSGELLKSSLKMPVLSRTKSLPSTKNVHFDSKNLCDVRTFDRKQQPRAVSIGLEFSDDSCDDSCDEDEAPSWTLDSRTFHPPNYDNIAPEARPTVYLEGVYMSTDKTSMRGNVLVRNISFEKCVTIRYTVDNWVHSTDTQAVYNSDIRRRDKAAGFDRFSFDIFIPKVTENYKGSTLDLQLAIKYMVNNQEFWDNNMSQNYLFSLQETHIGRWTPRSYFSIPVLSGDKFDNRNNKLRYQTMEQSLLGALGQTENSAYEFSRSSDFFTAPSDYDEKLARDMNRKSNSGLKSRYSFQDAYKNPLKTRSGNENSPLTGNTTAQRVFPSSDGLQKMSRISYQDVLAKYCFFTPGNVAKPASDDAANASATTNADATVTTEAGSLCKPPFMAPAAVRKPDGAAASKPPVKIASELPKSPIVPSTLLSSARNFPQQQQQQQQPVYLSKAANFSP